MQNAIGELRNQPLDERRSSKGGFVPTSSGKTTIAVAICTYKRNGPLTVLLESLIACAARVRERSAVAWSSSTIPRTNWRAP